MVFTPLRKRFSLPLHQTTPDMNEFEKSPNVPFNPPLRIFSAIGSDPASSKGQRFQPFIRPKLQRNVAHERVAQYFSKRGLSHGSSA